MLEEPVVAGITAKPPPTQPATEVAPSDGPAGALSNVSACASTLGSSSVSTVSGEVDVGGRESCSERPAHSDESRNEKESTSLNETQHGASRPTTSGGKHVVRAGGRGVGLKAARARGGDGWSTSRVPEGVCSLDEELILLDGILHDSKIRTWVETTLAPLRKHHHRRHA